MATLFVILAILILCLAASLLFYCPTVRISEAICYGIITTLLTLSVLYQACFLIGEPKLAYPIEISLVIASLVLIKRRKNYLNIFRHNFLKFWQNYQIITTLMILAGIYLGLQAILLPATGPDSDVYHLPRVLLFQQEKSLYLENVTTLRQSIFPVGWNILSHAFLRFYTGYGLGIFPFLVYLASGLGTYALARQITSPKISVITTLIIISMPQVVLQATSMNTDFPLAGVMVFCGLTLSRLYRYGQIRDLALLSLGIAFGLSIKLTFVLFAAPFLLLSSYLLLRAYPFHYWLQLVLSHWQWVLLLLPPVLILSQIWLYSHNAEFWGGWSGPPDYVKSFKQNDGIKGGFANLIRYSFGAIDLMWPTDFLSDSLVNLKVSDQLEKIYHKLFLPFVGNEGILKIEGKPLFSFYIKWAFWEIYAWYGILGFLVSIPSVIYASLKAKGVTKVLSLTLIAFALLVCYQTSWSPYRARFFSLFFVGSGLAIAYTISTLEILLKDRFKIALKAIVVIAFMTLFLTMTLNRDKPLLVIDKSLFNLSTQDSLTHIFKNNVWTKPLAQERDYRQLIPEFQKLIPSGSQVALLTHVQGEIYHSLLAMPHGKIIPIHSLSYPEIKFKLGNTLQSEFTAYPFQNSLESDADSFDYLLCIEADCQSQLLNIPKTQIWQSQFLKSTLFKLN